MKHPHHHEILENHPAAAIIEALEPYVSELRQARIDHVIQNRLSSIQLAIEAPSDINNALATIRSSEALGISTVHLINPEGGATSARTITQGAIYWVDVCFYDDLDSFLSMIQQSPLLLAGGTVTATQPIAGIPIEKPLCILIGNEQRGLSQAAQAACDMTFTIPMCGMSESLNLSVSAAISLYDTSTRKRTLMGRRGDLNCAAQQHLRAKYFLNSVNPRLSLGLLGS